MKCMKISIWDIIDVWNDRKEILDSELTLSIKKKGLEHALSVIECPNDGKYILRRGRRQLASLIELVTNHNCPHLANVMCEIHPYSNDKNLVYDRLRDERYKKRKTGFERARLVKAAKSLGASDEEIAEESGMKIKDVKQFAHQNIGPDILSTAEKNNAGRGILGKIHDLPLEEEIKNKVEQKYSTRNITGRHVDLIKATCKLPEFHELPNLHAKELCITPHLSEKKLFDPIAKHSVYRQSLRYRLDAHILNSVMAESLGVIREIAAIYKDAMKNYNNTGDKRYFATMMEEFQHESSDIFNNLNRGSTLYWNFGRDNKDQDDEEVSLFTQ